MHDPAGLPPFRRRDAIRHGLEDRQVRRLLAAGELHTLRHGVLVGQRRVQLCADDPRQLHALHAAACQLVLGRNALVSQESAGWLHGLPALGPRPDVVRLTRPTGACRTLRGAKVRVCPVPPDHAGCALGLPATSLARTVVDLARELPRADAVVAADAALRAGCRRADLEAVLRDCWTWRGIDGAGWVVGFADRRAESPLESLSRVVFAAGGLPAADLQVRLGDDWLLGVVDFYWRAHGVVGEADGLLKYDGDPQALRREKLRQELLEEAGFVVVRWGWEDITARPQATVERVRRALARGRAR
jgi:hypothetical protein